MWSTVRGGWAGALAEQLVVPVTALHLLPDQVDEVAGALVERGGNALRAVQATCLKAGDRLLIWGTEYIGLLAAAFAVAAGIEVHLVGTDPVSLAFARGLGYEHAWAVPQLPQVPFDAVLDATYGPDVPAAALELVEPGGRVVLVGLAGSPSRIDTRTLVLKDVTAVGILSASPGLAPAIEHYASGAVDPRPLVAQTVGREQVADVLAGRRPPDAGPGPKFQVHPRR